ncbi:MAG: MFS transporter [Actinomycetota bacterium]
MGEGARRGWGGELTARTPAPTPVDPSTARRTILGVSLASFFSDTGHEMATAVLPAFLRTLGAPAAVLGAIEGIADAAQSTAKLVGGSVADRPGVHRKRVAAAGYLVTGLGYASFALAHSWPVVAVGRAVAWGARGFRSPARDSLLAAAVPSERLGRAFGTERASDSAGAVVGPLVASALIGVLGFRRLFAVSFLPAIGASLSIALLVREMPRIRAAVHASLVRARDLVNRPTPFRRLLVGSGLYGLGNFSATLLILRATDLLRDSGRSLESAAAVAVLLYATHNAANALAAYPAGAVADRLGRRKVLVSGVVLFAVACFAFVPGSANVAVLGALFVAVGCSTGIVETSRGSYAAELLPDEVRGRGFGLIGLVDGVGDLVSSLVVGILWTVTAPAWGFVFAGVLSTAGALALARPVRAEVAPRSA